MLAISLLISAIKPASNHCLQSRGTRGILALQMAHQEQEPATGQSQRKFSVRCARALMRPEIRALLQLGTILLGRASEPNAFHESWFLLPALRAFAKDGQPRIFTLWDSEAADAKLLGSAAALPMLGNMAAGRLSIARIGCTPMPFSARRWYAAVTRRHSGSSFWTLQDRA